MIFRSFKRDNSSLRHEQPHIHTLEERALDFFNEIYSYDDLKEILYRGIVSEHNISILLVGPPATSKSLLLQCIHEKLKDCVYYDAANSSGPGIIQDLTNHRNARIILIDEIDKLNRKDQAVFYNLMETGEVIITKKDNNIKFQMDHPKIFATSNSIQHLNKPLRSRFSIYRLQEYSDKDFIKISVNLITSKFHFPSILSALIAQLLLEKGEKDIRKVLNIAKLIRPDDDVNKIKKVIETYLKYQDSHNCRTEFN
ncbi:MAG: AAA family ATPase [Nitrososphaeraceae archaeon]